MKDASKLARLRLSEAATATMIDRIDDKVARLDKACRERATALTKIRHELARAQSAGSVASENYEPGI